MTKPKYQIKLKTANPKSQTARKCPCDTVWDFGFGICHSFVIWILHFGISALKNRSLTRIQYVAFLPPGISRTPAGVFCR
jgi:hypothetical protein